jgi:hypothetical protein
VTPVGVVALRGGEVRSLYQVDAGLATESAGVVTESDMPSLEELFRQNKVAYSILERPVRRSPREVAIWAALVAASGIWSWLSALSFVREQFWLSPYIAVECSLFIVVLVLTLSVELLQNRS